jgi:hypothetical protein
MESVNNVCITDDAPFGQGPVTRSETWDSERGGMAAGM